MTKWEYKELNFNVKQRTIKKPHSLIEEDIITSMNDEGKKGWELVSVIPFNTNGYTYEIKLIFKKASSTTEKSFF
jgi:hypothetical protein